MFSFVRYVKSREKGRRSAAMAEAVTHSVWYDLCALYVLCDPVSLSLYSLSDRVTPWLSPCLATNTVCPPQWLTLIYDPSQRSNL